MVYAALVSLENVDRESLAQGGPALGTHPEFLALIESARQEFRAGKKVGYDRLEQAVKEMPDRRCDTASALPARDAWAGCAGSPCHARGLP